MGLNNGKFSIRTSLPESGNKFYNTTSNGGYSSCIKGSPIRSGLNVLSNCVGWACSRFNEVYSLLTGYNGIKYGALNCNAENFIERAKSLGLQVVPYPVLGGIIVWQKGSTLSGSDGAGHVEFVEDIYDSDNIFNSASNYGGTAFYNANRNNSNGRWGLSSSYTFRGCIVNPAIGDVHYTGSTQTTNTTTSNGLKVGDKVKFTGRLYRDSNGNGAGATRSNLTATISIVKAGAKCPYNINNGLGWVRAEDLTPISTSNYSKGNYKTLGNMNVRTGAGTNYSVKKVSQLTADGRKNATSTNSNANAVYKTGTVFTALEIINNNYGTWAKTPSGYVCIKGASGTVYCSKI